MLKLRGVGLMVVAVVLCGHTTADAANEELVQRARSSVAHYELGDGGIISVLGELSEYLSGATGVSDNVGREVRFLRAAASADLMFVAGYTADEDLMVRLAGVWGLEGSPRAAILADLKAASGIYREPASHIARLLGMLTDDGRLPTSELDNVRGAWRDITLLHTVAEGIGQGTPDRVLAELGKDPCVGIKGGCDALFMASDADSRRSLSVLREVGRSMKRLNAARRQGDPLTGAIGDLIDGDYARIAPLELRVMPMLKPEAHVAAEGDKPGRVPVDLLVVLHTDSLQYGYVPRMRLDENGDLQARAIAEPSLPRTASVAYPPTFRPHMRPMSEVVEALGSVEGELKDLAVGVTTAPGVESHILGRVLLSLRKLGHDNLAVVGPAQMGAARGVALRVVEARDAAQQPKPQIQVRVRLGGYSLRMGPGLTDIPRVRGDSGLRFDTATLEARVSRRKIRSASVSFMGNVAVENLLSAVWRLAPDTSSLNFVVP